MRVKRFVADTMQDVIQRVKAEFGPDAVILQTRRIRKGGILGLFGRRLVEVVAAIDPVPSSATQQPVTPKVVEAGRSGTSPKSRKSQSLPAVVQPSTPAPTPAPTYTASQGRRVRGRMTARDPEWPKSALSLYEHLIDQDLTHAWAEELVDLALDRVPTSEWQQEGTLERALDQLLQTSLSVAAPWDFDAGVGRRIVALVGPTGVGKTTTIAKLAANFALVAGRRVGLVTVDTYRIAAVEQLKTYAELIGIPVEVALTPAELRDAVHRLADRELLLVDTAGRSVRNALQLAELRAHLDVIPDAEVHLVLSATTRGTDLPDIISGFGKAEVHRLVVTKLDETSRFGVLYNAVRFLGVPISYVTTGQSVPEDIEVADQRRIAGLLLGRESA